METLSRLPYRIRTPRLELRCYGPEDARRRKDAVDASGEHLAMLTREGPLSLDAHAAWIRMFRGQFDTDGNRVHGAFDRETGELIGEAGLLTRAGLRALEVSYWVVAGATGRGLATEMAQALIKVAFQHDRVLRMDLVCRWDNDPSAAVARRLGFTFEGRLRDRQLSPRHERCDLLSFTLLAGEYLQTGAANLPIELFDFLDRPVPLAPFEPPAPDGA